MKKNNSAFTLIEILVWVSISVTIMISVWVFVTSGIKNITLQKSILNQESEYIGLFDNLNEIFSNNFDIVSSSNTWFVVKTEGFKLWKPQVYDFSIKTFTWACENDATIETKYLELKNYNPFTLLSGAFSGSYLQHEIYRVGLWKIAGKWFFWDNFVNEMTSSAAFLNNPGGISHSWASFAFISDTGNNKVLYYLWGKLYSLFDIGHWLYQPTGLLYNAWELFILNSGNKELWKVSSKAWVPHAIDITWKVVNPISFNKISFQVSNNFNIAWSYSTGSFIFDWFSASPSDDVVSSSSQIVYSFSWSKNLSAWNTYGIKIPTFTGNFSSFWASYLDVIFYEGNNQVYQQLFPYAIHGDNNLLTSSDNDVKVFTWGLKDGYYSEISLQGSNLLLKDYINKKQLVLSQNGAFVSSGSLSWTSSFETSSKLYDMKMKDMQISHSGWVFTLKMNYYKNFDCYNPDENIVKTFLFKKAIPN